IDLENGVMRIPREDSKNGFQHQIQLTPQAIQEFRFLLRLKKKGNPYVFPGQKEKSHISQPRHLFNKIKKELMLKEPDQ
ncbi:hypothetical protein OFC62_43895, partial [Escherichia coli]|nr:hypothetical protein [Escherichia coli]